LADFEPAFDGSHWLANASADAPVGRPWKLRLRVICATIAD
jgi:hypothetical protein